MGIRNIWIEEKFFKVKFIKDFVNVKYLKNSE